MQAKRGMRARKERSSRWRVQTGGTLLLALALGWGCAVTHATEVGKGSARARDISTNRVQALISKHKLGDSGVGVHIIDAETGETLASHQERTPLIPASNQKLLTTGAALLVLGPDFAFRTELRLKGDTLTIKGSGDPALADPVLLDQLEPKLTVEDVLESLAGSVKKAGVTRLDRIVLDDRIFDREYIHPGWKPENFDRGYSAQVAGLNFHLNIVSIFPTPSKDGPPARPVLGLEPFAPWLDISNEARTVNRGKNLIRLSRMPGTNRIRLLGEVRGPFREPESITIHEPPMYFGQALTYHLLAQGIGVGRAGPSEGTPTREQYTQGFEALRLADAQDELADGQVVAVVVTPLDEILQRCNSDSQNLYAEALLKRLGHEVTKDPGSWSNSASVIRMMLSQELGPEMTRTTTIADGSGLARDNRVAAATLTRWLRVLRDHPKAGQAFIKSLSVPGEGSIRRRFGKNDLKNDLRAKSGSIDGVRCLSGYVISDDGGRCVIFSVLVNTAKPGLEPAAVDLYKDIVMMIDESLTAEGAAEPHR
jgi:serine-type D-Ala-D-Ala carboxypeptidase/endopeptidase (penicillin-binding protein 4)